MMLRQELNYPEDRALHFVKRFDHNKDGRLSASEFGQFKSKIAEAYVTVSFKLLIYQLDEVTRSLERRLKVVGQPRSQPYTTATLNALNS